MMEHFFSLKYAGRADLFEGLSIWQEEKYRLLQGTYPVISLTFANVKEKDYKTTVQRIGQLLADLYNVNSFLLEGSLLTEEEKLGYRRIMRGAATLDIPEVIATMALHKLSDYLYRYYGKKVIILLDEYDTPMQESYVDGYWEDLASFTRSLFNASFKTNPYLERAIMTGITRVSRESVFSDLNNLKVITTTSDEYAESFGFTQEEVNAALSEYGLSGRIHEVKNWYDGFTFGHKKDIYNPWSIINFLDTGKVGPYWANTSSNNLVGKLIREGSRDIKISFEKLLLGESLVAEIDEQIIYGELDIDERAIWSLLLASGYLKVKGYRVVTSEFGEWRFYHGFVLGLMVELTDRYVITSNRESGYGRYDVMLRPRSKDDDAVILEFKVRSAGKEHSLEDTAQRALTQIEEKEYAEGLIAEGIPAGRIRKYGFAFEGKNVFIKKGC